MNSDKNTPRLLGAAFLIVFVASILYGFGSGIILVKPNFKAPGYFGALLIMLFEVIIGGWLLFYSPIIP